MRWMLVLMLAGGVAMAQAQRSAVPSDKAGNILNGSPELANQLPQPQADSENIGSLLDAASKALQGGRTGEAQEALEQAETRALDRSVPYNDYNKAIVDPVTNAISQARIALGNKDIPGAQRNIAAARAALQPS